MSKLSKKTKLALLVVLLAVVAFAGVKITSAWLTDTNGDNGTKVELTVGKVDYEMSLTNNENSLIVPGDNLISAISVTNKSTVKSQFRMKIEYSVKKTTDLSTPKLTELTALSATSDTDVLVGQITGLTYNNTINNKGYWYFGGTTGEVAATNGSGVTLEIPNFSLSLNGKVADNSYVGAIVTIKITFEAKQHDNVEWKDVSIFQTYTAS